MLLCLIMETWLQFTLFSFFWLFQMAQIPVTETILAPTWGAEKAMLCCSSIPIPGDDGLPQSFKGQQSKHFLFFFCLDLQMSCNGGLMPLNSSLVIGAKKSVVVKSRKVIRKPKSSAGWADGFSSRGCSKVWELRGKIGVWHVGRSQRAWLLSGNNERIILAPHSSSLTWKYLPDSARNVWQTCKCFFAFLLDTSCSSSEKGKRCRFPYRSVVFLFVSST